MYHGRLYTYQNQIFGLGNLKSQFKKIIFYFNKLLISSVSAASKYDRPSGAVPSFGQPWNNSIR